MENQTKTTLYIVEDHHIFRMGLIDLINNEADLEVCGEAADQDSALKEIREKKPDMAIIDITLTDGNGLSLIEDIQQFNKDILILVLSMHDESFYAERALQAGARGYIMKQETSDSVVKAIRQVLDGKIYVSEKYQESILDLFASKNPIPHLQPHKLLTNRELEVYTYIGQGLTTKNIAKKLNLGTKTIGTYRERIKEKLHLKNANELIKHAVFWEINHNRNP